MNFGLREYLVITAAICAAVYVYVVFPKWLEKFDIQDHSEGSQHTHGLKEPEAKR